MPNTQLPNEWGGKRVVTGLADIRTQPNDPDLVSDVIVYDLPPNNQAVLFSGNGCKLAQYKQKDYKRFFVANTGDVVSVVLNKRGKAELLYNHATGSYGSLKLRRLYRKIFEGSGQAALTRIFVLFVLVLIADSFIDTCLMVLLTMPFHIQGDPVMFTFLVLLALINPISHIICAEIYYALQAKKAQAVCDWLKANCAPRVAAVTAPQCTAPQYSDSI